MDWNCGKLIDHETADRLLDLFRERFITPDYDPEDKSKCWLLWCNLSCRAQLIPTEQLPDLPLERDAPLYAYSERDQAMFQVTFAQVCDFVMEAGPWMEVDAEVFDGSFRWFIAITHEDLSLVYGFPAPGSAIPTNNEKPVGPPT